MFRVAHAVGSGSSCFSAANSAAFAVAVYIFRRTGVTWAQEAYLKAPNAEKHDGFGESLAVSVDTVVVGAGSESSNQTTIINGATASADNSAFFTGAVYIFRRTDGTWIQEAYLKAPNADMFDGFGNSVAVSGDTVAVGATGEDSNQTTITNGATASADNSAWGAGAVYVFRRTGVTWAQEAYLKAPNAESWDSFGNSVAVSGDTVAVGSVNGGSNQTTITNDIYLSPVIILNAGAVYIFKRTGVTWTHESYLKSPNAASWSSFGNSVAVSGDTVAVGSDNESSNVYGTGAVYIFVRK